jgi:hypothetical protein
VEDIGPFVIKLYRFSMSVPVLKDCGWKGIKMKLWTDAVEKGQV